MTRFPFYPPDRRAFYEAYAAEFAFDHSEPTPWMPLRKELRACKLGMVTTSALRSTKQEPFRIDRARGSAEYREISIHSIKSGYTFDLGFESSEARRDLNTLVPIDPLIDLAERRIVRELDETLYSFVGHCEDWDALRGSVSEVAGKLLASGVDAVLIFTAGHLCNRTAGWIARELEKRGLSTLCLVTIKEVAQQMRIPRSVFVNFPFGMPLGPAYARSLHESIVGEMIHALRAADKPGRIVELPWKWS
jgi:D-proline reductase (dithiol) PrdB